MLALVASCYLTAKESQARAPVAAEVTAAIAAIPTKAGALPSLADLAARINPAVVSIQVEQSVKVGQFHPRGGDNPFRGSPFEFFFRQQGPGGAPQAPRDFNNKGLGSGIVIGNDGLILTNNHVIEGADTIEIGYQEASGIEKTVSAKLLGAAPEYDVALIKAEHGFGVTPVTFGDSDGLRPGDWVMAIGSPFGLSHSVSVGIISAKGRTEITPSGREGIYDFLQTDASINPGNSGGPLLNMQGEVVGVNTAINAQGQGIGFAIPINMVKKVLPQLEKGTNFQRAWLGVKVQPVSEELAQSYGLDAPRGGLVAEVVDGSPAAKAGVKEGDIILRFDDQPIVRSADLPVIAGLAGVGSKARVVLWREGGEKSVTITLEAFPGDERVANNGGGAAGKGELGMALGEIGPEMRAQLGLSKSDGGALLRDLDPNGVAARAGLRPGDVVLSVNGRDLQQPRDFVAIIRAAKPGSVLRLKVRRNDGNLFLALRKP
ncbi:MAG: trypsin-like peptidase domain-containing protein [Myxococcota bacterium]